MKNIPRLALPLLLAMLANALYANSITVDKEQSEVGIDVKLFPIHSFSATLDEYLSEIKTTNTGNIESAQFAFQFEDLDSKHKTINKRMRKWMEIDQHPEIDFTLSHITKSPSGLSGIGTLRMHGVSKEITIPITFEEENGHAILNGKISIAHENWDLPAIKFLIFKIRPEITIDFRLVGKMEKIGQIAAAQL